MKALLLSLAALNTLAGPVQIPYTGEVTEDGHYKVYDLQGHPYEDWWISGDHFYTSRQLRGKMIWIRREDLSRAGYVCGYVCVDREGRVVGLNPIHKNGH